MNFLEALRKTYVRQPGQILPNALWKTRQIAGQCQTDFRLAANGTGVERLEMWQTDKLFLYWDRDGRLALPPDRTEALRFALIHDDYSAAFPLDAFSYQELYFRLTYYHQAPSAGARRLLPADFSAVDVGAAAAADAVDVQVSRFLSQCYENVRLSAGTVAGWREHPTFVPDLWLWLVDEQRGQPAALGIAEYDADIAEGALEWIQVLPAYRRRGLGMVLVTNLLARLKLLGAGFTTVAGRIDNASRPEALYRRCGFAGSDRWWLLRR